MKPLSGKQLVRIIERHGWVLLRIRGSHHIFAKAGVKERISIPIHGDKPLKMGLLKFFLKRADIKESEIE